MEQYFVLMITIGFMGMVCAFVLGHETARCPSEEEMFNRLVDARRARRFKREASAELDEELDKRAAQ